MWAAGLAWLLKPNQPKKCNISKTSSSQIRRNKSAFVSMNDKFTEYMLFHMVLSIFFIPNLLTPKLNLQLPSWPAILIPVWFTRNPVASICPRIKHVPCKKCISWMCNLELKWLFAWFYSTLFHLNFLYY